MGLKTQVLTLIINMAFLRKVYQFYITIVFTVVLVVFVFLLSSRLNKREIRMDSIKTDENQLASTKNEEKVMVYVITPTYPR